MRVPDDLELTDELEGLSGVVVELTTLPIVDGSSASYSGSVITDQQSGPIVITSGFILKPLLNSNYEGLERFVLDHDGPTAIFSGSGVLHHINHTCDVTIYSASENSRVRFRRRDGSKQSICKQSASIQAIWRVTQLDQVLDSVLSTSSGWSFANTSNDCKDNGSYLRATPEEDSSHTEDNLTRKLLPFFVLLTTSSQPMNFMGSNLTTQKSQMPLMLETIMGRWMSKTMDNDRNTCQKSCKNLGALVSSKESPNVTMTKSKDSESTSLEIVEALISRIERTPFAVRGDKVKLVSTPFGSLSPDVFLNCQSEGIVTNVAGEDGVLIMTDARCVPGCEGGSLYYEHTIDSDARYHLLGIIVAPFCWRRSEWVGLTFVCSARPMLSALWHSKMALPNKRIKASLDIPFKNIALVKVGSHWGSAVVIDKRCHPGQRLLITCSHVTQKPAGSKVTVHFSVGTSDQFHIDDAVILYSTPLNNVYDIAVIRMEQSRHKPLLPSGLQLYQQFVNQGDQVRVMGHGLFDEHSNIPASVTAGIIAKVLHRNERQVLIQSTCAVHPGVSGGALLDAATHQLVGIVVCNARDAISGACYPHINLSIPASLLHPILCDYTRYEDVNVFRQLHEQDPIINNYWQLESSQLGDLKHKL